jgi:hypothetical protein
VVYAVLIGCGASPPTAAMVALTVAALATFAVDVAGFAAIAVITPTVIDNLRATAASIEITDTFVLFVAMTVTGIAVAAALFVFLTIFTADMYRVERFWTFAVTGTEVTCVGLVADLYQENLVAAIVTLAAAATILMAFVVADLIRPYRFARIG